MPTTYKKFLFITTSEPSDNNTPTVESLETIFQSYVKLADLKKRGIATPFLDVLEIPEDFYDFIVNQITVNSGIVTVSKSLVTYEDLNAKILCLSRSKVEEYLSIYKNNLKTLLEKLTKNLGDLTNQIVIIDKFENLFLPPKET